MSPDYPMENACFRTLCAELLEALQNAIRVIYREDGTKHISTADAVIAKADAALAQPEPVGDRLPSDGGYEAGSMWTGHGTQPEPVGPTDEEIMDLMPQQMHEDLAAAARALAEQAGTDSRSATGVMRIMLNRHAVDHARAILARWGRPAITPIPVSERLPGPEDCDAEGRCWWGRPTTEDMEADWFFTTATGWADFCVFCPPVVWLPFHALPLPAMASCG